MKQRRVAVIGAGPVGLEAALYAAHLGFEVEVFEKDEVGAHPTEWGHVTLFSPWHMNHTSLGLSLLRENTPNFREPNPEDYLTGKEHADTYLKPLSELEQIAHSIKAGTRVEAIGRTNVRKGDLIGDASRANHPFRILTTDVNGNEKADTADVVIDASGVYDTPNWLGEGGIPAIGERRFRDSIEYKLVDVYGKDRTRFAGKKTLLLGGGYSAATTVSDFRNLIREEPETSVIWAIQSDRTLPIPEIEDDPLPNRARLTRTANAIAGENHPAIEFHNATSVVSIQPAESEQRFRVGLRTHHKTERVTVDRIIANVGFGPDNSIYQELQVHECYASRGPMKLSAALLGSASGDCLTQTSLGADTLRNPEPNFYIVGNKSYGRNSTFLLRVGFSQIVEVFSLITGDTDLNVYAQFQHAGQEL